METTKIKMTPELKATITEEIKWRNDQYAKYICSSDQKDKEYAIECLSRVAQLRHMQRTGEHLLFNEQGIKTVSANLTYLHAATIFDPENSVSTVCEISAFYGHALKKCYNGSYVFHPDKPEMPFIVLFDNDRSAIPLVRVLKHLQQGPKPFDIYSYFIKVPEIIKRAELPNSWPLIDLDETVLKNN